MEAIHPSDNCTARNPDLYMFYFSVMIVEFILALPLNISVMYVFIFKLKFWKSKSNNIFLFNLVLADILLLICLLVRADSFRKGERRSENNVTCRAVLFLLFLNRGASIAFLTVVSINRYFSVVHPGIKNPLKVLKRSVIISCLIWAFLLPMTIPTMLKTFECCNTDEGMEDKVVIDILREVVFFSQVLIPFAVLVYCTVRIINRLKMKSVGDRTKLRRAVFLVISVMLVFSVCFLPSAISRMVLLIMRGRQVLRAEEIAVQVYDGLMCLSYLDCLLDPIVYCLSSTKFKNVYLSTYLPCLVKETDSENE
ncbi:hydroxycarboxylic acid receptor 2 [Astyanax mexicanus]|uniref:12-(S)-hydroxy-5,8,10,14-eicosatetraenoic acid receptor n=1 Tax=Astyanax mexicanus TaxID=7994 RepID=A0A8T2MF13_ASTMX|nr:hydroxycarboxylic acid receptor 2 [Astyanax mexicanus]KAG9283043.1 12-(S)-hydroxy-5,8,10,14-eicosatetraenoic acid receptor [Astyanax mexicanus]